VSDPGDRSRPHASAARDAWIGRGEGDDDDTIPAFMPLLAPDLASMIKTAPEEIIEWLRQFGLNLWNDPRSAQPALRALADVLEHGRLGATQFMSFRAACRRTWHRLVEGAQPFLADESARLVAASVGDIVIWPSSESMPLYVEDTVGGQKGRVLEALGRPV